MLFNLWMFICFGFLLIVAIINGLCDLKLFKTRGEQLCTFKSIKKDNYILLVIQVIWLIIAISEWRKQTGYMPIAWVLCIVIATIIVAIRCFKKNGFYEQMISVEGIYYAKERVRSYYWTNYVMQSESNGLMLEVTNLLNKKKTSVIEVTIPRADREKIESILNGYGVLEKNV